MKKLLAIFRREDDVLSMYRICLFLIFTAWFIATLYLLYQGKLSYETLTIAMLLALFGGVANKAVESKILSVKVGDDDNGKKDIH